MKLEVLRYRSEADFTLGLLFEKKPGEPRGLQPNMKFLCHTLEDEYRLDKVSAETRIPAGTYEVKLRTEGGFHQRYSDRFPDLHEGMLHVTEVPNFQYVLIHIGNTEADTAGCLLVGSAPTEDGRLTNSTRAYKKVYAHVLEALKRGEQVTIEYLDYDTP
jgi:hypothetical protein